MSSTGVPPRPTESTKIAAPSGLEVIEAVPSASVEDGLAPLTWAADFSVDDKTAGRSCGAPAGGFVSGVGVTIFRPGVAAAGAAEAGLGAAAGSSSADTLRVPAELRILRSHGAKPFFVILSACSPATTLADEGVLPAKLPSI